MVEIEEQTHFFMRRAIQLAEKGRFTAPPNPWVGALIVKEGRIVGEGYHRAPGAEHAEITALKSAGPLAKGATAFVSLEPCVHWGKTPPCVQALIEAKVGQVVIPLLDPDLRVAGKGVELLKKAGIHVVVGVAKQEAECCLEPYLYQRRTKLPFCVLKTAISIDGRTAAADGSSKWITGREAREDAQRLRASSQAILVGSQTAIADLPKLTVREIELSEQPLRVLLDSKGRVAAKGPLFDTSLAPTLIFTTDQCRRTRIAQWQERGCDVVTSPLQEGKVDLSFVLEELARRNIIQLMIEGGAEIHAAFLTQSLANLFVVYVGGCLLGPGGKPLVSSLPIASINEATRWQLEEIQRFGNDIRLNYRI